MLQGEKDAHLGYKKDNVAGNNTDNSRNESFPKTIQTEHRKSTIKIPKTWNGKYDPIIVSKHQIRRPSIENISHQQSDPCSLRVKNTASEVAILDCIDGRYQVQGSGRWKSPQ